MGIYTCDIYTVYIVLICSDLRHDQETQLAYRHEIAKIRL